MNRLEQQLRKVIAVTAIAGGISQMPSPAAGQEVPTPGQEDIALLSYVEEQIEQETVLSSVEMSALVAEAMPILDNNSPIELGIRIPRYIDYLEPPIFKQNIYGVLVGPLAEAQATVSDRFDNSTRTINVLYGDFIVAADNGELMLLRYIFPNFGNWRIATREYVNGVIPRGSDQSQAVLPQILRELMVPGKTYELIAGFPADQEITRFNEAVSGFPSSPEMEDNAAFMVYFAGEDQLATLEGNIPVSGYITEIGYPN